MVLSKAQIQLAGLLKFLVFNGCTTIVSHPKLSHRITKVILAIQHSFISKEAKPTAPAGNSIQFHLTHKTCGAAFQCTLPTSAFFY